MSGKTPISRLWIDIYTVNWAEFIVLERKNKNKIQCILCVTEEQ